MDEEGDFETLGEFKELLKKQPRLDEELEAFAADLENVRKDQPLMALGDLRE